MKHWLLAVLVMCLAAEAKILYLAPGGGSAGSEVIQTVTGNIQCGPASGVMVEHRGDSLKVVITSRRTPQWQPLCAGNRDDDVKMFAGETAEVFLKPEKSADYYHFAVNPKGNLYSARNRDFSWSAPAGVKTKTVVQADRWTAEFEIPYAAVMAVPPQEGEVLRANFCISTFENGIRKAASWSGAVNYHEPQEFGKLIYSDRKAAGLVKLHVSDRKLHGRVFIPENLQGKIVTYCIVDGIRYPVENPDFSITLSGKEINPKNLADVEVRAECDGKTLFSYRSRAVYQVAGRFELDAFYVVPGRRAIKFKHDLQAPVEMRLLRQGRVIRKFDNVPASGVLQLDKFSPGRLMVELRSLKNNVFVRKLLIVCQNGLEPAPLAKGGASLDEQRVRIGGKPAFLIGCSSVAKKGLHADKVFNFDLTNYGDMDNAVKMRGLPRIKLIRKPTVGNIHYNNWQEVMGKVIAAAPAEQLVRVSYEAQLDVYFKENGQLKRYDSAPFYRNVYEYFKKKHPHKIFSIQCDRNTVMTGYVNSCDIFEGAFWSSSYAENIMANIIHDMDYLKRIVGNKPAIFWLGASIPRPDVRQAEELRAGVYCAVFKDMAGVIFHTGHDGVPTSRMRLWSLLSGINAEISSWYHGYADGEKLNDFIRSVPGGFLARAWRYQGRIYVGVVNLSARSHALQLEFSGGRKLTDEFIAYDAKIYVL